LANPTVRKARKYLLRRLSAAFDFLYFFNWPERM